MHRIKIRKTIRRRLFLIFAAALVAAVPIAMYLPQERASAAQSTVNASVSTAAFWKMTNGEDVVFISDQVGYSFYRASGTNGCAYSKTTNGGSTWGAAVIVDANTVCSGVNVWYDRWTPGNTTGTLIHILSKPASNAAGDRVYYNTLDTSNDSLALGTSPTAISTDKTNTIAGSANRIAITVATNGVIFAAMGDGATEDTWTKKCSSSCTTGTNWVDSTPSGMQSSANVEIVLRPLASGNVLYVQRNTQSDDLESSVYNSGTTTWSGAMTTVDSAIGAENTSYSGSIGATINPTSFDVYVTVANDNSVLGTDDDIKTYAYSSGSWSTKTDVLTNESTRGVKETKLALDTNTGDIYCVYVVHTTAATSTTSSVYYKKSTDGMATWGAESSALNTVGQGDFRGLTANMTSDERLVVTWQDISTDDVYENTVVDLTPPAATTFTQSGYRFLVNANSVTPGAALAATNTAAVNVPQGTPFRLRYLMHSSGALAAGAKTFKLQYALSNGTCDTAFSGETYGDVGSSGAIQYFDNATPADGATISTTANDPTHASDTKVMETYEESNNFTTVNALTAGQDAQWDFSLLDTTHTTGAAYCFRVVESDGTVLSTYSVIPELTQPSNAEVMRGGNSFGASGERGSSW